MTTHGPIDSREISLPKSEAFAADPDAVYRAMRTDLQETADAARDALLTAVAQHGQQGLFPFAFGWLRGTVQWGDLPEIKATMDGLVQGIERAGEL